MCNMCDKIKRQNPTYIFCPYCGKNYDPLGFKPSYVTTSRFVNPNYKRGYYVSNDQIE